MENPVIEIPEHEDGEWKAPVIREGEKKPAAQTPADILFMQYVVCVLLLTALFAVRVYDEALFRGIAAKFLEGVQSADEPWLNVLLTQIGSLWK